MNMCHEKRRHAGKTCWRHLTITALAGFIPVRMPARLRRSDGAWPGGRYLPQRMPQPIFFGKAKLVYVIKGDSSIFSRGFRIKPSNFQL